MNQKELNDILQPNDKDKIFIHNGIFNDLIKNDSLKSVSNIAFAYSYYCLIVYLYRYCKYANGYSFTPETIKEMLGYNGNNKTLDFIIKKDGILDQMHYTETIRDFPISYEMGEYNFLNFTMYNDLDNDTKKVIPIPKNFRIKYPVVAFYRNEESRIDCVNDGTFYDIQNTHLFDVHIFIDMVGNSEIGIIGFYLYQFLQYKNNLFKNGYAASYKRLEREIKMSSNTLDKYAKMLEKKGYLQVSRSDYIVDANSDAEKNPNVYKVKYK